jgi:hypothetical protein
MNNEVKNIEEKRFERYDDITDQDFKELEQKHGKLKIITVPLADEDDEDFDPNDVAKFVLKRNPKRQVLKSIKHYASQETPNFAKIEALSEKEILLGGDMIYLDEDKGDHGVYMAVQKAIGDIAKGRTAKLGKR